MVTTLDDLGNAMVGQLYDIVCGGDGTVAPGRGSFLTWCHPGLPFQADENTFALARLVDFVPDVDAAYTRDHRPARLSTLYGEILSCSRVVHNELTPEEQQKIEKYRGLLRSTKRVTEDGPMLKAYNEKLAAYLAAVLRYNTTRVVKGDGEPYRAQVSAAMDAWICGGYRDEVDQINAYIEQITSRDLVLWRQSLLKLFDDGLVSVAGPDQRCYHTTLVPADFAAGPGWSRYQIGTDAGGHQAHRSWKAGGGGLGFGLVSAAGSSARYDGRFAPGPFTLSFELRQVLISRPWFYPEFLGHRGWAFDRQLCDGGDPPKGSLVGYPTAILLARDVRIESAEFARVVREYTAEVGRQAGVGWGPLLLGPAAEVDARGVSVPGMQIVGFVNRLLGRTPNPLPELDPERLV